MTDEDLGWDARIRAALVELPVPDDAHTRRALAAVLAGSRRRRRTTWRGLAPILAMAATVAILLTASLAGRQATSEAGPLVGEPSRLVATWRREVTTSTTGWRGDWTMTMAGDGVLTMRGPAAAGAIGDGASYAVTQGRVRVDVFVNDVCAELPAGEYSWARTGDTLTLDLVQDPCVERSGLLAGVWQRSP